MPARFDSALDCGSPAAALPRPALLAASDPQQGCASKRRQQGCRSPKAALLTPHPSRLTLLCALLSALCALLLSPLAAQQPAPPTSTTPPPPQPLPNEALGYIRFVNATGHDGKLRVTFDGIDVNPVGYTTGQATGAVGFPPKSALIGFRHDTLGETQVTVTLKPGTVTAVLALPLIEKDPKPGQEPKIELTHHIVESPASSRGRAPVLTILQTTALETMELKVAGQTCAVGRLKPESLTLANVGEFAAVSLGGQNVATLNFTDPADQVLVLFTNDKGVLKQVSFSNQAY